jgi:hypothetical protein
MDLTIFFLYIDRDYIEKQTPPKGYRFSDVIYRSNLHYIIDNIKKPSLLIELKKINER